MLRLAGLFACASLSLVAACGSPDAGPGKPPVDHSGPLIGSGPSMMQPGSGPPPGFQGKVYAHDATTLYQVDPKSLSIEKVSPFQFPNGPDQMTDIALDKLGNMVGISFDKVYAVDKETGLCQQLSDLSHSFNGLSFVPAGGVDNTDQEDLIATTLSGTVYKIDPMTGTATALGDFGADMGSSGDVVSIEGLGTFATVTRPCTDDTMPCNDWLAKIDPRNGAAIPIGDTGFEHIYGLGFWAGKVYGFTADNQFLLIEPTTGRATLQKGANVSWWGAGVTTKAPIVE